jgi:hypothetical protein
MKDVHHSSFHHSVLFRHYTVDLHTKYLNMAHGISDPECKKEYFDSESELDTKLDQLAQWIGESQHLIVFTGISNYY